jgi:hypothetical protein
MPKTKNDKFDRYNRNWSLGWSCVDVVTDAASTIGGFILLKDLSAEHDTFNFTVAMMFAVGGVIKGVIDIGNTGVKFYDFWRNRKSSQEEGEKKELITKEETSPQNQ